MILSVTVVMVLAGPSIAQVIPRRIEVDKVTCADLLASRDDARYHILVYLNGYMNGSRGQKVWDEPTEGERIERALNECKAAPTRTVLDVFGAVWPR